MRETILRNSLHAAGAAVFVVALVSAATINLENTPPLWWDEGWNLSVARNWVELGHYGRLLSGDPISAGLATGLPGVAPVALSFQLLGVGVTQGRIAGVFFTFGALICLYYLACRTFDYSTANATMAVLLLMSPRPEIHSVMMGRQVLGEMPMLFYLLLGYVCFLLSLERSKWYALPTILLWGLALSTKAQVLPFWLASMIVLLLFALYYRRWALGILLLFILVGSRVVFQLILGSQRLLIAMQAEQTQPLTGLYSVTALITDTRLRLIVLFFTIMFALPTVLGLCDQARFHFQKDHRIDRCTGPNLVCLGLLILASSWLLWFILLAAPVIRYMFPATFVGSIFAAKLLDCLTSGFNYSSTVTSAGEALRYFRFNRKSAASLTAILLIGMTFPSTIQMLYHQYLMAPDNSAIEVANFLNTRTPKTALIETYDSEIFFLLDRKYHYPPDSLSVQYIRRGMLEKDLRIEYDPLLVNPDYLVVGPFSRGWQVYEPVLKKGKFKLLQIYGPYEIFVRLRNTEVPLSDSKAR